MLLFLSRYLLVLVTTFIIFFFFWNFFDLNVWKRCSSSESIQVLDWLWSIESIRLTPCFSINIVSKIYLLGHFLMVVCTVIKLILFICFSSMKMILLMIIVWRSLIKTQFESFNTFLVEVKLFQVCFINYCWRLYIIRLSSVAANHSVKLLLDHVVSIIMQLLHVHIINIRHASLLCFKSRELTIITTNRCS